MSNHRRAEKCEVGAKSGLKKMSSVQDARKITRSSIFTIIARQTNAGRQEDDLPSADPLSAA